MSIRPPGKGLRQPDCSRVCPVASCAAGGCFLAEEIPLRKPCSLPSAQSLSLLLCILLLFSGAPAFGVKYFSTWLQCRAAKKAGKQRSQDRPKLSELDADGQASWLANDLATSKQAALVEERLTGIMPCLSGLLYFELLLCIEAFQR